LPRARLVTLIPVVLAAAGCGGKQSALDTHSPAAGGIASLWWNMLIGASLGLGIVVLILVASWVRRRRTGVPGTRDGDRAAFAVVLGLGIVVPILTISALFFFADIFLIRRTAPPPASAATNEKPEMTIRVIGHQYWWEVRYPGTNAITANEIHIPVRTRVEVLVHTDDVIHSFWFPSLNRKIDAMPEQVNRLLLYADRAGRYRGQCAEFCGLQHAHMGMYLFADEPAAFRAWLRREARPAPAAGSQLFVSKCGSCHRIRGTDADGVAGPDLTHVGSRTSLAALTIPNTAERMRAWIRDPQAVKPGNAMPALPLTPAQVARLTAYLEARK
jgi:cytochrome c oxidase subunit 2